MLHFVDLLGKCELSLLRIVEIIIIITQCVLFLLIICHRIVDNILPNPIRAQPNQPNPIRAQPNQSNPIRAQPNPIRVQPNLPPRSHFQPCIQPTPPPQRQKPPLQLRRSQRVKKTPERFRLDA